MSKLAIVATMQIAPGKRDEYLTLLVAHGRRCLENEPGTLKFEIMLPHDKADTVMLYEVYASKDAFDAHWNGESVQQIRRESAGLMLDLSGVRCDPVE